MLPVAKVCHRKTVGYPGLLKAVVWDPKLDGPQTLICEAGCGQHQFCQSIQKPISEYWGVALECGGTAKVRSLT